MNCFIFWVCFFILAFNQLAFGGVHAWAATLSQVVIFAAAWLIVAGWSMKAILSGRWEQVRPGPGHPLLLFLVLFFGLWAWQLWPLPPDWVGVLSPETLHMHLPLVEAGVLEQLGSLSLSLDSFTSLRLGIEHMAQALFFLMVLYSVKSQSRVQTLAMGLVGLALFQVIYGLIQSASPVQHIWWWERTRGQGWLTGTYINRNHLAGFLELAIPVAFGLGLAFWPESGKREETKSRRRGTWKGLCVLWLERSKSLLFFSLGVFFGVGLLLTGSRGGVICLAAGVLIIGLLFAIRRSARGIGLWLGVFLLVIAIYGIQVGVEETADRFEQTEGLTNRLELSAATGSMLADYPVTGIGLGGFRTVYSEYEPSDQSGRVDRHQAHNDWLQVGAELGLPGLLLALAGYLFFLVRSLRLWYMSRDRLAVGLGGGLLIGYLALGLHSFFDFNLHIPANILSFAICLALLHAVLSRWSVDGGRWSVDGGRSSVDGGRWSVGGGRWAVDGGRSSVDGGRSSVDGGRSSVDGGRWSVGSRRWTVGSGLTTDNRLPATDLNSCWIRGAALLVLIGSSLALVKGLDFVLDQRQAEALCRTRKNSTIVQKFEPGLSSIQKALELTPGNSALWDRAGRKFLELSKDQAGRTIKLVLLEKAVLHFEEALLRSPANGYYWLRLGETRFRLKILQNKAVGQDVMVCLERALELRPNDQRFRERVAFFRGQGAGDSRQ
ncbi:MAG: O-antigen ligase family protein [Desulfohalobiaceae bacterium]|nr:O-antigen ligase family protein [Desulfohalobiaceae bacterium]